jgi:beta-galactosidase
MVEQMHRVLYASNVGVDFIRPEQGNFSDYRVVVVPALYISDDVLLQKLSDYVKSGGHVVMTCKSGFADENSAVRSVRAPGPLREAAGLSYEEFSSLSKPLSLKGDPFAVGTENKVYYWAEMLQPEHAQVLARYDHPFFGRWAAITENRFGAGTLTYEGTWLSDELQKKILRGVLQRAGLTGVDQSLPPSVRVKNGVNAKGELIHYLMNYSSSESSFPYPYGPGHDLITGTPLAEGQKIVLKPWDLIIGEEISVDQSSLKR